MKRHNYFKILSIAAIAFFLVLIAVRVYLDISNHNSVRLKSLALPATLVFTFTYKSGLTWVMALILFLYGIYYYLFESVKIAYPGVFEFTLPLNELFFGSEDEGYRILGLLSHCISLFPMVFYPTALIVFMTVKLRKMYWTSYF
jgi:hypothetical protein